MRPLATKFHILKAPGYLWEGQDIEFSKWVISTSLLHERISTSILVNKLNSVLHRDHVTVVTRYVNLRPQD